MGSITPSIASTAATDIHTDTDLPPILQYAPPLDPAWLAHERAANLETPKLSTDPVGRQPIYAADCRRRNAAMMAPGKRDHRLAMGIATKEISVASRMDGFAIPVLQYDCVGDGDGATHAVDSSDSSSSSHSHLRGRDGEGGQSDEDAGLQQQQQQQEPQTVIIYYHGGGLLVGETDSEDLSCRRLVKDSASFLPGGVRVYSVGYRLKPQHKAAVCVADSIDAFAHLAGRHQQQSQQQQGGGRQPRIIIAGSSSGGELAAFVSQHVLASQHTADESGRSPPLHGVLLRCPVASDSFRGPEYVPSHLREIHTSARDPSFQTTLLTRLDMEGPRDGLERMPLEVDDAALKGMPRTWIQVCTNDVLYSDGACYARVLRGAGAQVKADVVWGWPHTFWLKAPHLERAEKAEEAMLEGLKWLVS
ncbi:Alpha/Beta hydrolase protein [Coniella lustricola]|uniref:Alpha/Beta hydrolase protein n=1 Tax=Coniella lustricola TaxID=2025994 RepID=A0A2T3ABZ4_9PEZI|nr:Alpha/Beta hydrolase protein [Coniella lustricola]